MLANAVSVPIVIICHQNVALDKFISSCIDACHLTKYEVVRMGGQSKDPNMSQYKLSEHRRRYSKLKNRISIAHGQLEDLFAQMQNVCIEEKHGANLQLLGQLDRLRELEFERDLEILKTVKVIAITTSSASMNSNLIKKLCPSTILVEEAALVFESHIIASL